ncbi:MAG TPA: hypothetical protein VJH96_04655 [Patescibacteria group bacterium]|nr:hypothetical protein [Patescibacteria group bacterium]
MNLIKQFSWRCISQSEIRNSAAAEKNWNRKARAGKNSFPPTPFLFARPSDWILKFRIRIFVKKSSNFVQKTPLRKKLQSNFNVAERAMNLIILANGSS